MGEDTVKIVVETVKSSVEIVVRQKERGVGYVGESSKHQVLI